MKNIRLVKYQTISFSDKLSGDRIDRAQDTFGEIAIRRLMYFSLYLLGLNRQDIGKSIDLGAVFPVSWFQRIYFHLFSP